MAEASEVLVDVFLFEGNYYSLSNEKLEQYSICDGNWNEHYIWAQSEININIEATIEVNFEEKDSIGGLDLLSSRVDSIDDISQQEI